MKIRLAAMLQSDSIVDGEGIRTVVWTQGCPHHCKGCHNPETWEYDGGQDFDIDEIKKEISLLEGQSGITFSGGDPVFQSEACTELAKHAKKIGLDIWVYTGYLYEDMLKNSKQREFLSYIDILVDGPFEEDKRSLNLTFRGSSNQRVIDVPASLVEGKVILINEYMDEKKIISSRVRKKDIYI